MEHKQKTKHITLICIFLKGNIKKIQKTDIRNPDTTSGDIWRGNLDPNIN
jgi:hypothetical protein